MYFGTGLDAVESSTHTGVRAEGLQPNDVGVIVAFLDIEGRVIGQHTPSIDIQTDQAVGSERVDRGTLAEAMANDFDSFIEESTRTRDRMFVSP